MARVFPSELTGSVSPEVAKVLQALKRVPGDDVLVWVNLELDSVWRPRFMVIDAAKRCHLFVVSAFTQSQAEGFLTPELFSVQATRLRPSEFHHEDRRRIEEFVQGIFESRDESRAKTRGIVACPNVSQATLDDIASAGCMEDCVLWGREMLRPDSLVAAFTQPTEEGGVLDHSSIDVLRQQFSPEITIPDQLVARAQERPSLSYGAQLTGMLLDLDQEYLTKDDLTFSEEAEAATRDLRLRLVTGVAGSGKSLILLYRAMLQAKLDPEARILILTHNRPLSGELRERFIRICPKAETTWTTFYQWCREFSSANWTMIKPWEREVFIRELVARAPALSRLPLEFIIEEVDWIRDQGFFRREEYLGAQRVGRKRPLQDEQRAAIFSVVVDYSRMLKEATLQDWVGAAASVWNQVQQGTLTPPVYDSVLIDEAQFFAPIWLQLVKRAVKPGSGHLFLAADPTQGFLKRRQSWAAGGLNVRGHSSRLLRCYRNTREILSFAAAFYRSRVPGDDEDINLPSAEEMERLPPGAAPEIVMVDSSQGERARVANEIVTATRAGAKPEHFLVLQAEAALVEPFMATLNRSYGAPIARDLKDYRNSGNGKVKVSSINAATGLESPVVFLCGIDSLLEAEGDPTLDEDQRSELIRDNTRKLYMGMTRASQKLVITRRSTAARAVLGLDRSHV